MNLLARMQGDLLQQTRDRVAERIVREIPEMDWRESPFVVAGWLNFELRKPSHPSTWTRFRIAEQAMNRAIKWAGLKPPEGWLNGESQAK